MTSVSSGRETDPYSHDSLSVISDPASMEPKRTGLSAGDSRKFKTPDIGVLDLNNTSGNHASDQFIAYERCVKPAKKNAESLGEVLRFEGSIPLC